MHMNVRFTDCTGSFSGQGHALTMVLAGCLSLSACGQVTPTADKTLAAHARSSIATDPHRGQPLQAIVKFRHSVPYQDRAFLQKMGEKIHASVAYVSSVSPDTHVYQINTKPSQDRADILRLLGNIPEVLSVEADAVAKPF